MNGIKGITAKEARYKSDNAEASVEDILSSVFDDIRMIAASGDFSFTEMFSAKSLSINDLDLIVADLEKRGFVVHKESNENDHNLTISWECKE